MRAPRLAIGLPGRLLGALVLLVLGSSSALAEELVPGSYTIVEVGVLIEEKTAKGKAWDRPSSPPDPAIELRLNGEKIASCKHQDTFEARCDVDEKIKVTKSTVLTLVVVDSDIASDDSIGSAKLGGLTNTGQPDTKLVMEVDGQLSAAHVILRKAPSVVTAYKSRFIGLGVGLAIGLLLLVAFKDYWFRVAKKSPPPKEPAT